MKVFDCFPFFNELEILELRLMELDSIVDFFVIAEANKTHNGTSKEFVFENNKDKFKKWIDKIIYVKIEDMPEYSDQEIFRLEYFQRNAIQRGLEGVAELGDKIILSDCDEIPNVDELKKHLNDTEWVGFAQDLFYYYVNNRVHRSWCGTAMAPYGTFRRPQSLRWFAIRRQFTRSGPQIVENGGWHYSYMTGGDAGRVRAKVALFAEKNLLELAGSVEEVDAKMKNHEDLYNRSGNKKYYKQEIIDISKNKPHSLDEWLVKYPNFIFK